MAATASSSEQRTRVISLFPPEQYSYANFPFLHKYKDQKRVAALNFVSLTKAERERETERRKWRWKQGE
jgi:hypothetical protein